jgi:site-specific DNA recombinase
MRVAIYARVSSDKQDVDLSISAQLKALREYAIRNGHEVVKEFIDEAESGKTTHRPAFREMVSMARRSQKPFDCILVWKYSRFARSREDSIVFKTLLRKNGVRVVSINEPSDDTPTGKLFEAMIESLDEFYSANLGEEVTRGMRESASRGFYIGNYTPYGYRKVKVSDGIKERPKLVPDEHEAPIVARMFNEVLEGKGLKEILKGLNREGIAGPRGREWIKTTVHGILTNEVYTGTLVWGRHSVRGLAPIRVENAWRAIVSRETFDNVQSLLKSRAPSYLHPKRTASHFLLSGIAKCGYCGKALVGHDAKNGQFSYYVCGTLLKKGAGSCPARYINGKDFENAVVDKIKEHILTEENLKELVRLVNEEMDTASVEYQERLDIVLVELEDTNHRLARLYDVLETSRLELEDLAPRIQELRRRQVQLLSARAELEQKLSDRRVYMADMETVTRYVKDLRNLLDESPLMERKSFIKSFIKEAKVTGAAVSLIYTIPISPRRTISEEPAVLPIVHYGGPLWTRTTDPGLIRTVL